jgi:hypothetical protein
MLTLYWDGSGETTIPLAIITFDPVGIVGKCMVTIPIWHGILGVRLGWRC